MLVSFFVVFSAVTFFMGVVNFMRFGPFTEFGYW